MTTNNLIDFIDRHTNNGAIYPSEPWSEGIGTETEGVALIQKFSHRDWFALRSLNLKAKKSLWIECLITLLGEADTEEARQMIIHIALTATEDNFFEAMEHIREFRRYVDTYTWLKLQNRSTKILSKRIKNKSNNY